MTDSGPVRLEVLVEEPSAEVALRSLLPRIVPDCPFEIISFDGKHDLLRKLPQRRHGYHRKGLAKFVAAEDVAPYMDVDNNRSRSFQVFRDGLRRLVKEGGHDAEA